MALAGRLWRRAVSEFSGIVGGKGRLFSPLSVAKQWPLPEKGVYPSYTQERFQEMMIRTDNQGAEIRILLESTGYMSARLLLIQKSGSAEHWC